MSNRLKILAIVTENLNASADSFELCFQSEATRVWELYQAGIIREMNFRQDKSEAVLMLECAGIEDPSGKGGDDLFRDHPLETLSRILTTI
jgi:hypothetical protein